MELWEGGRCNPGASPTDPLSALVSRSFSEIWIEFSRAKNEVYENFRWILVILW